MLNLLTKRARIQSLVYQLVKKEKQLILKDKNAHAIQGKFVSSYKGTCLTSFRTTESICSKSNSCFSLLERRSYWNFNQQMHSMWFMQIFELWFKDLCFCLIARRNSWYWNLYCTHCDTGKFSELWLEIKCFCLLEGRISWDWNTTQHTIQIYVRVVIVSTCQKGEADYAETSKCTLMQLVLPSPLQITQIMLCFSQIQNLQSSSEGE